jgi:hypothetical protein
MYKTDPNYEKWLSDFHSRSENYPYDFQGYNEATIAFWHSDETIPFMKIRADSLLINPNFSIDVFSRDCEQPIAVIWEWDYWKIEGEN